MTYATTQRIEEKVDASTAKIEENLQELKISVNRAEQQAKTIAVNESLKQVLCRTSAADDVEETFIRNRRTMVKGTGEWYSNDCY